MGLSVEDPLLQAEQLVVAVEKVEILQGLRQEERLLDIIVTSSLSARESKYYSQDLGAGLKKYTAAPSC